MKICPLIAYLVVLTSAGAAEPLALSTNLVRVAAAQAARRVVDYRRLSELESVTSKQDSPVAGIAAMYPGDVGIGDDPDVLFADDFEAGDMKKWDQQRGRVVMTDKDPHSGRWCVQMLMERGLNQAVLERKPVSLV
jgi:hypothetical protein